MSGLKLLISGTNKEVLKKLVNKLKNFFFHITKPKQNVDFQMTK